MIRHHSKTLGKVVPPSLMLLSPDITSSIVPSLFMRKLLMSNISLFQAQYVSLGIQKILCTLTLDTLQIAGCSRTLAPGIVYVSPNLHS